MTYSLELLQALPDAGTLRRRITAHPEEIPELVEMIRDTLLTQQTVIRLYFEGTVPDEVTEAFIRNERYALHVTCADILTTEQLRRIAKHGVTEVISVTQHTSVTLPLLEELFFDASTKTARNVILSSIAVTPEYSQYPTEWVEELYGNKAKIFKLDDEPIIVK